MQKSPEIYLISLILSGLFAIMPITSLFVNSTWSKKDQMVFHILNIIEIIVIMISIILIIP
ncbi:hypothetical protein CRP01_29665 [Flavilitoribacter nigricans DSM 23189 = NBRC 102662]|uniref:Uncharacterized protein n=1 Tax=Flavilitoribacter nigricans (strain ATCC 23147 / DSM 23189 / NBRC 102662 / NCIMB 1420 / SS-2) TaxID=1122177 RepID=A0A2D0N391_FLAN2|nr:hypothetical protein CRP01_29665 [Flavilitoribacter nigricans DSM 23189 = NBRC 102662]